MATIGEVQATVPNTDPSSESKEQSIKVFFGIFFDGTGNNMVQRAAAKRFKERNNQNKDWEAEIADRGIHKENISDVFNKGANILVDGREYSNVAILHSHYQGLSNQEKEKEEKANNKIYVYNIYIEGVGVEEITHDKDINPKLRKYVDNILNAHGSGMGWGATGVVALVSKAIHLVKVRLKHYTTQKYNQGIELHFDVIGFSRGAACARLFAFMVATDKTRKLPCENDFDGYLAKSYLKNGHLDFLDDFKKRSIDYLGIFDTVSSIGMISYDNNATDYGLYSPSLSRVKSTFHLCALDEFRSHFAITDIGNTPPSTSLEIFIPGCHSDVGGGYLTGDFSFNISTYNTLMEKNKMYTEAPHSKNKSKIHEINEKCLIKLGWLSHERCKDYNESWTGNISFNRNINQGYSNIPLKMMAYRSEKIGIGRTIFRDINDRYTINKEDSLLNSIQAECLKYIIEKGGKRFFYYPDNSYSSEKYRKLRSTYLHFSATDDLFEKDHSSIVHNVSYDGNLISRYMYHGDNGDSNRHFINDYE